MCSVPALTRVGSPELTVRLILLGLRTIVPCHVETGMDGSYVRCMLVCLLLAIATAQDDKSGQKGCTESSENRGTRSIDN